MSHENILAVHIFKFDKFGHLWCLSRVLNVPEVTPGKLLRFLKKHTLSRWSLKEALELSDDISEEVMSYARQQLWWIRSDTCQRPQCAGVLLKFWNYCKWNSGSWLPLWCVFCSCDFCICFLMAIVIYKISNTTYNEWILDVIMWKKTFLFPPSVKPKCEAPLRELTLRALSEAATSRWSSRSGQTANDQEDDDDFEERKRFSRCFFGNELW